MKIFDKGKTQEKTKGQEIAEMTKCVSDELEAMTVNVVINTPSIWFHDKDAVEKIGEELVAMKLRLDALIDWLDDFGEVAEDARDLLEA